MSEWFPEKPIPFYASLATRFGVEQALLLSILDEFFSQLSSLEGQTEVLLLTAERLQARVPFWSQSQLHTLLSSLESHQLLQRQAAPPGVLKLCRSLTVKPVAPTEPASAIAPVSVSLPVYDSPPPSAVLPVSKPKRSPAPTFGGNAGWRRGKDELQQIFEQHEERNQRLLPMEMNWRPSDSFYAMLSRQAIPTEFAQRCLDEFILYWLEKDRKETNWDQKFLAWVKREWVRQQTRDASNRFDDKQPGQVNENTRRDTRENRKRVTASIMDIEDTNW